MPNAIRCWTKSCCLSWKLTPKGSLTERAAAHTLRACFKLRLTPCPPAARRTAAPQTSPSPTLNDFYPSAPQTPVGIPHPVPTRSLTRAARRLPQAQAEVQGPAGEAPQAAAGGRGQAEPWRQLQRPAGPGAPQLQAGRRQADVGRQAPQAGLAAGGKHGSYGAGGGGLERASPWKERKERGEIGNTRCSGSLYLRGGSALPHRPTPALLHRHPRLLPRRCGAGRQRPQVPDEQRGAPRPPPDLQHERPRHAQPGPQPAASSSHTQRRLQPAARAAPRASPNAGALPSCPLAQGEPARSWEGFWVAWLLAGVKGSFTTPLASSGKP